MTRNKYGVFEILVEPLAKRKVAIPHGSKVKVKRKKKIKVTNTYMVSHKNPILDHYDNASYK